MDALQYHVKPFFSVYADPAKNCLKGKSRAIAVITESVKNETMEDLATKVRKILDSGADVNRTSKHSLDFPELEPYVTALCIAAEKTGDLALIKELIAEGAIMHIRPSKEAQAKIDRAAKELTFEHSRKFFPVYVDPYKHRARFGKCKLKDAIASAIQFNGMESIASDIKELIEAGEDVNRVSTRDYNFPDLGWYFTALDVALKKTNNLDLIKVLLSNGAITHQCPSKADLAKINHIGKELLYEQIQTLYEAKMDETSLINIFPVEIQNEIIAKRIELGPLITPYVFPDSNEFY
ncbi:MAG TPA: hypothetical protein VGP47_08765 [Parachlamydiaceae bacterium]|nr:hypothetical protein [Parachlamydiaceae bacterium]